MTQFLKERERESGVNVRNQIPRGRIMIIQNLQHKNSLKFLNRFYLRYVYSEETIALQSKYSTSRTHTHIHTRVETIAMRNLREFLLSQEKKEEINFP